MALNEVKLNDAPDNNVGRESESENNQHRVLVVDDNVEAAESLATLLRLQGHDVRLAHNGPQALVATEAFHPEIVILDIGFAGIDGYEVARRSNPSLPSPWQDAIDTVAAKGGIVPSSLLKK